MFKVRGSPLSWDSALSGMGWGSIGEPGNLSLNVTMLNVCLL